MNENDIDRFRTRAIPISGAFDRNRLRSESGLPLLDVGVEAKRLGAIREQAEFELEWQRRRPEFAHQWVGNSNRGERCVWMMESKCLSAFRRAIVRPVTFHEARHRLRLVKGRQSEQI